MSGLSFRERILVGIIASGVAISLFAPSIDPKPTVPDGYVERECARGLGITWDREQGATERLEAFQDCVRGEGK